MGTGRKNSLANAGTNSNEYITEAKTENINTLEKRRLRSDNTSGNSVPEKGSLFAVLKPIQFEETQTTPANGWALTVLAASVLAEQFDPP